MKKCRLCKVDKPFAGFHKKVDGVGGVVGTCKECVNHRARERYKNDPEYRARLVEAQSNRRAANPDYQPQYLASNEDTLREKRKAHWAANRNVIKAKQYGLTPDEYDELMSAGCAICGSTENLCVDHDHSCCPGRKSCGQCVRGALCGRCNSAIGLLDDDVDRLMSASAYLMQFKNVLEVIANE